MKFMPRNARLRIAGLHLGISATVAMLAALVVFLCWYPSPFAAAAGATKLFALLVSIDVVLGPALTLLVAKASKPRAELARDLAVIALIQLAALSYGMYSLALARPVALVFELDQFRLIAAADVESSALGEAPVGLRQLSWSGPRLMASVKPSVPAEQLRVIDLELAGIPLAASPRYWREYAPQAPSAWRIARPIHDLIARYPGSKAAIDRIATAAGQPVEALRFLPLRVRGAEWIAILSLPDARVVGHLPLDGFF
jgi:hypothetical protein